MRSTQRNILQKVSYGLVVLVLVLFGFGTRSSYAQGLETLADELSNSVLDYFSSKGESNIRFSIIKFENFSGITDLAAHKFYQQSAARLEGRPQAIFIDLMINFSQKKGEFNLNRIDRLDYLVYLKLIKNLDKVGAGIAIFSRSLDKIVYIKYFEENFPPGESNIYETVDYGFKGLGFSRQIEIDVEKNLLDFRSITAPDGEPSPGGQYFFFYPGEIEIFKTRDRQFKKFSSIKLTWGRPYYPVMDYEGKLCLFYRSNEEGIPVLYLTAGSNYSPRAKVLSYQNNQWQEIGTLDFVPIKAIHLNNSDYLTGALYDEGKNYFKEKLVLVPFAAGKLDTENPLEKKVVPFFTVDFSLPPGQTGNEENVDGVHLIDSDYNYRFYAGDFQEQGPAYERRGSALAALDGQWLAVSDYSFSTQKDKLYFYKIQEGSKQAVYENAINGSVIFISDGSWQNHPGFWVYVKEMKNDNPVYRLQFWSKNIEKQEGNN